MITVRDESQRQIGVVIGLSLLLLISLLIGVAIGPLAIPMTTVIETLISPLSHLKGDQTIATIIWQIRFPRVILATLVGGTLACAGLSFQALLRNDLAEPYTTGVSAGSSVGVGIVVVGGWMNLLGGYILPVAAFVGGIIVLIFNYTSSLRSGRIDIRSMLLLGVVAGAFLWAAQMLLLRLAGKSSDEILGWLMGSLSDATWQKCAIVLPFTLIGIAVTAAKSYEMNLFSIGELNAEQLGVNVEDFKKIIVVNAALLTAAAVSVAGIVAFVGLIAPHIARRLARTPDHRRVVPITILSGMLMMIWSDTIARDALGGDRLPVGVVTAFCGAPFFWWLLRREQIRTH